MLVFLTFGPLDTNIMSVEPAHLAPQFGFFFAWQQTGVIQRVTTTELRTHTACQLSERKGRQEVPADNHEQQSKRLNKHKRKAVDTPDNT